MDQPPLPPTAAPAAPSAAPAAAPVPQELNWTFNPWRDDWRRPASVLAGELVFSPLAGYAFTAPWWWPSIIGWSTISLLLLLGMTAILLLPVRYRLDQRGVTVYFPFGAPSFRAWEHYRNFYPHRRVVHLTTMPQPSPLDPFRGHALQFAPDGQPGDRSGVLAMLSTHIRPAPAGLQ